MDKKVLILKGSPRENGNSTTLANQVMAGAKESGVGVESIYLHGMDIRPCDGCFLCLGEGKSCVIEDDMQSLYPKLLEADAIVFASPIYWFNISAQLKLCIDRFVAFETRGGNDLQGKIIGIVLSYGDTDIYTSGGINAIHAFQSMFHYLKGDIVGMVYGTGNKPGEISAETELMERAYQLGSKIGEEVSNQM